MNNSKSEVAVGLFVVMGFVILSLIVFFISGIYFFRPGYHLNATFYQAMPWQKQIFPPNQKSILGIGLFTIHS